MCAVLVLHSVVAEAQTQSEWCLLHGAVVRSDSGPIKGIRVAAEDENGSVWEMRTDQGGQYSLVLPAPARYRVTVHFDPPFTVPVNLEPGVLALNLGGWPTLTGVVTSAASRRVEPHTLVVAINEGGERWETRTNDIGYYQLRIPPGQYRVGLDRSSTSEQQMATVIVGPDFRRVVADIADRSPSGLSELFGFVRFSNGRFGLDLEMTIEDENGYRRITRTTELGTYSVKQLPAGKYTVTVKVKPPFESVARTIDIPPGDVEEVPLDIVLDLRKKEEIRVLAEGSAAIRAQGSVGQAFSREEVEQLPLSNGRTIQSLLSLVPGIVVTDSVGTLAQFTAAGQRRYGNRLTIDGMSADIAVDAHGQGIGEAGSGALPAFSTLGSTQTLVPLAAIDEIQVRTTNASSGQARTPGAQTSIVTRAGSDRFTGAAFYDRRPSQLGAADWFDNAAGAPKRRVDYWNTGASIGGPLLPSRLFSFATWERQHIERPRAATVATPSLALRDTAPATARAVLNAFPQPNSTVQDGSLGEYAYSIPAASDLSAVSVRLDAAVSARHRAFARFNRGTSHGDALTATRQLPFTSFSNTEATKTNTLTGGVTSVGSSFTHELRMNVSTHEGSLAASRASYGDAQPLPLNLLVPTGTEGDAWSRVTLFPGPGGFLLAGRTGASRQNQLEWADTWTLARGRHEWRVGFDYRRVTAVSDGADNRYTYRFNSTNDLLQGRLRQLFVDHVTPARARMESWSVFAEDTLRVGPRLSFNYGIRYGVQPAPASLTGTQPLLFDVGALPELQPLTTGSALWETSWAKLAPRVAGTYQLRRASNREMTLHGALGLVFDDLTNPGAVAFGRGYPYAWRVVIPSTVFPVPQDKLTVAAPASFESSALVEAYAFPKNFRSPRTYQWQVGIDQALGQSQRVAVSYVGAAGRDLVYPHAYYIGDAAHIVHGYSNDGASDYHALLAEYAHRLSRGFQARVAYSWSHAIDLDSGESQTPNAPPQYLSPWTNRGSADFDRRHVLRVTASYQLPTPRVSPLLQAIFTDWQVDVVGVVISGGPFSVVEFRDIGFGNYMLRPDAVAGVSTWLEDSTAATGGRVNPAAFVTPTEPRQGTLGRNTLRASTLRQVDLSLTRRIRRGERVNVQLRLDAFNVFNIPNFGRPDRELPGSEFGRPFQSYAEALGTGTLAQGGLVPIQQIGGPRGIQLGVRFGW